LGITAPAGQSQTLSTKRNSLYNLGGPMISVAIMLVTVPLYLAIIGEARFGVLAIIWLLTSYFGLFELGMGRVVNYRLARLGPDDNEQLRKLFWTSLVINGGFGLIGAALMLLLARPLFDFALNLSPEVEAELLPVLPWIALGIPALTLENVMAGALAGRQRFLALNLRAITSTFLAQAIPLIAVLAIAPTLAIAVPAAMIARWMGVAVSFGITANALKPGWRVQWGGPSMARSMLGMGSWLGLADAARLIFAGLDRILIGAYLGAASVARYAVPYQLVLRGGVFAVALPNALFPRLAGAPVHEMEALALRGLKANAAMMLVLCTIGILAMEPFLTLWIDENFARSAAPVGELIALSLWLSAVAIIPLNLIQAHGRMRETAILAMFQFAPFLAIAFPAMAAWGIAGVALARNASSFVDMLLVIWRGRVSARALAFILPCLAFLASCIIVARSLDVTSAMGAGMAFALIGAALIGAGLISPDLRIYVWDRMNSIGFARQSG
jgi:O-antigen/teichoic acid export membrane protein